MIRHVVLLTFEASAGDDAIDDIIEALAVLPTEIPEIRAYTVRRDLALADGNAHLAITGDFDDVAGYEIYRDHPVHQAVITERIRPILGSRAAAQFEL